VAERIFYRTDEPHGLKHDPFNAIVGPRPIGWISSIDNSGVPNLAPYSFFNAFNYKPPIIGFASIGWKDSVRNIAETREFCWNLATRGLAVPMNESSAEWPAGVDEFAAADIAATPARLIRSPMVALSPVSFECRLTQIVELQDQAGGSVETWLVLGQVVGVHIDPACLEDGVYQTDRGDPLLRAGGAGDYYTIDRAQRLIMKRPRRRE
jgi:flavin reductase (DIM6/NTAB) family NADH-FMN oxidoreductase RutF